MISVQRHLSDDNLIDVCLHVGVSPEEEHHLKACERCEARRADFARFLGQMTDAAVQESDAVFSPERLAKQHARILQRIEHEGRPARVIAFPAIPIYATWTASRRPAMRWLAGAAACGLVIGVLAGHFAHQLPARPSISVRQAPVRPGGGPTLLSATATLTDDEFLGQIESALENPSMPDLRPLDDLTPTAWEAP